MKKLVVTLSLLVAIGVTNALAQGTIIFGNTSAFKLLVSSSASPGGTTNTVGTANTIGGLVNSSVRIALFVGTNGAPISALQVVNSAAGSPMVTNSSSTLAAVQGTFSGGTPAVATVDGVSVGAGSSIEFMYLAWSISTGFTTPAAALAAWVGQNWVTGYVGASPIVTGYSMGGGTTAASATFGTGATQIPRLVIVPPVPEPTTFALAGLGAAAMLVFRRRK